ncbi:MAG: indolepyruvate ferredoxin oxidoreductase subunit alpha [Candidatus Odinarchaeota archaeon]
MVKTFREFPGVEWIEETGDFIKIDKKKCTGCSNCVNVCLGECFLIVEKKAQVKTLEKCMECASCWYVCPEDAIIFTWPIGGTGYKSDWG